MLEIQPGATRTRFDEPRPLFENSKSDGDIVLVKEAPDDRLQARACLRRTSFARESAYKVD